MSEARRHLNVHLDPDAVPGRRVIAMLFGAWAITIAGIVIAWGLLRLFEEQLDRPVPDINVDAHPPRLLHRPMRVEWPAEEQRLRDEAILHSYAWVDPEHRVLRIPIERAMDLAVAWSGSESHR